MFSPTRAARVGDGEKANAFSLRCGRAIGTNCLLLAALVPIFDRGRSRRVAHTFLSSEQKSRLPARRVASTTALKSEPFGGHIARYSHDTGLMPETEQRMPI
jgi:hypothetical protein